MQPQASRHATMLSHIYLLPASTWELWNFVVSFFMVLTPLSFYTCQLGEPERQHGPFFLWAMARRGCVIGEKTQTSGPSPYCFTPPRPPSHPPCLHAHKIHNYIRIMRLKNGWTVWVVRTTVMYRSADMQLPLRLHSFVLTQQILEQSAVAP